MDGPFKELDLDSVLYNMVVQPHPSSKFPTCIIHKSP